MAVHIYNEPTPDLPHPAAGMPRSSSLPIVSVMTSLTLQSEHTYPHEFGVPTTCLSEPMDKSLPLSSQITYHTATQ